jgi:hypothetical protein
MPHPKNNLKLTGDTHLPELEVDMLIVEDSEPLDLSRTDESASRVYADGYVPTAQVVMIEPEPEPEGTLAVMERKVEEFPARSPWLAIGAGVALGWLVARMVRMAGR